MAYVMKVLEAGGANRDLNYQALLHGSFRNLGVPFLGILVLRVHIS